MRYLENFIFEKFDGRMWFGDIRITLKPDNWYHTKIFVNRWCNLEFLNQIKELIEEYFLKRIIINKNSFKVKQNKSEKSLFVISFKFKTIK